MTPRLPLTKLSLQGKRWLQRTDYHTMRCNALPAKFLYYDGSIKVQKEPVKCHQKIEKMLELVSCPLSFDYEGPTQELQVELIDLQCNFNLKEKNN
ncbi:unnamed protein product [Caretta caretta]